jgi:hypothetical protein
MKPEKLNFTWKLSDIEKSKLIKVMGPWVLNGTNGNEMHIIFLRGPRLLRWAMWPMGLLFTKLWPLHELKKISWIISFPNFFSLCLQIFIWYLVHRFAIPRYRLSLSLALIHWFFTKLWPLDLEKYHELSVFRTFSLSLLTDIHLMYRTLFFHTKLQIKFKFDFYPFEFHEVMAHGLRKTLQIVSFFALGSPPYWLCSLR